MPAPLRLIEVAHASNTGRVRSHNEDRAFAKAPLLAVADGMGGAKAGEVAAQIAIDAVANTARPPSVTGLREGLVAANDEIRQTAGEDPSRTGMGTTVTAALFDGDTATLMHVGDSRGYLIHDGRIRQLTDDHSVVAEMVRQGQLAADAAKRHPSRNIITRALGAEPAVEIDELRVELADGDIVLLCSDGLSSLVDDEDIQELVVSARSLEDAARDLVNAALEKGGTDNITVVLGRIGDRDAAPGVTGELPVVSSESTERIRIPTPPDAFPKSHRPPVVLEPTSPDRGRLRRGIGIAAVLIILIGAFGAWAASRTYFVDGDEGGTVQVYHGAPLSIGGLDLFAEWADTGLATSAVEGGDPAALGRTARGQGDAVHRAVDLVWRFGLTDVPPLTVPPPPAPARPAPAANR
jgi:protein phosphatase